MAEHLEIRLLQPERLEEILAAVLDRRQERTARRREHIAEPNKRAAETDLRLKRLYDAIEIGVADLDDPALKERIAGLKAICDQAQADADRARAMAESVGQRAVTPAMIQTFARTARERIRIDGGGYRREHLRALAQRVEVADDEVRTMGSKGDLLRTLATASGVKLATPGVYSSVLSSVRRTTAKTPAISMMIDRVSAIDPPPFPPSQARLPATAWYSGIRGMQPLHARAAGEGTGGFWSQAPSAGNRCRLLRAAPRNSKWGSNARVAC